MQQRVHVPRDNTPYNRTTRNRGMQLRSWLFVHNLVTRPCFRFQCGDLNISAAADAALARGGRSGHGLDGLFVRFA